MPRAYAYPTPRPDGEQDMSHPLARNTAFYLLCDYVYGTLHMTMEGYLKTASRQEQRLGMKYHHLRLLKDAFANSTKEQRAKFPA